MKNQTFGVRISSSAQLKPVPVAGFINKGKNSVKTVSRIFHYRKPRIVKGARGWYIVYYFRIPHEVRHLYDNKQWHLFRIKEDINRRKGKDREQYAEYLRDEIENSLRNGYNPFEPAKEYVATEESLDEPEDEVNATDAIFMFLEAWEKRGLAKSSLLRYKRTATRLIEWLEKKRIPYRDIKLITTENIEQFLSDLKRERSLSNREYNNTFDFTRTIFNYLVKKKIITESPCAGIDKLKTKSTKHRYYNEENLRQITHALQVMDPYIYLAFQTIYYICIRSEKELINLKVKNILWENDKILIEVSKGNYEAYVPMDVNIKKILLQQKINEYPGEYYVFGINGHPSEKPVGNGFFSKRFRKVREKAGLSSDFTLYAAKHTRVIHLKQDGLSDADIMSLTRHRDFSSYATYLRDLGMDADAKKINKLSREI